MEHDMRYGANIYIEFDARNASHAQTHLDWLLKEGQIYDVMMIYGESHVVPGTLLPIQEPKEEAA